MENLNLESLRYLAGVNKTLAECGVGQMSSSGSPASINITAGSGSELTGMLKDIMNLAGLSKVDSNNMPVDSADAGPSTVISAPPMAGAQGNKPDMGAEMHKLMAIVDGPPADRDSMNKKSELTDEGSEDRMYDSSPQEKVMGDPMAQFGDINSGDHRERQKGLPVAKPMEATFKKLFADYEQFISEGSVKYDKKTGQMKKDDTDSDQRHGLYLNGKLVKTCNTKDEAENTKKRDAKFKTATVKKIVEGKVKELDMDLKDKTMTDAQFKAKYKCTRAECRAEMKNKKVKEGTHTQHYTPEPEKKKSGIGSKIAGAAKKVMSKVAPGDEELVGRLEKSTGGKRPNKYN